MLGEEGEGTGSSICQICLIFQNRRKAKKTFILVSPIHRWENCGQKDDVCLRTSTGPEMASDEVFHRHFSSQMFICWWCPIEANYLGGKIKIWCLKPHMGSPVLHTQASFLQVDVLWSYRKDQIGLITCHFINLPKNFLQNLPFGKTFRKSLRAQTCNWILVLCLLVDH